MVKKKCNKVNCFNLISFTEKFCEKHLDEKNNYDKQRFNNDKEIRKVYNNKIWRNTRESVLMRDDYCCLYCRAKGYITKAECVDHYIAVRDAYEDRYNEDVLVSSCNRCNTRKAVDEDKLRRKQITLEEYKSRWKY